MLGPDDAFAHLRGHPAFDGVNRISRATAGSPGRYPRRRERHPGNIRAERCLDTDISHPVIVNRLDNTGLWRCNSVRWGRSEVSVDHTTISVIGDAHRPRFDWRTVLDGEASLRRPKLTRPKDGWRPTSALGCELGFREHARERHSPRIPSMRDASERQASAKRARCRCRGRAIPRGVRSTAPPSSARSASGNHGRRLSAVPSDAPLPSMVVCGDGCGTGRRTGEANVATRRCPPPAPPMISHRPPCGGRKAAHPKPTRCAVDG